VSFFKRKIVFIPLCLLVLVGGFYMYWTYDPIPKYKLEKLYLNIDAEQFEKLNKLRVEAIEKGYLERSEGDYVPAEVIYQSNVRTGKIRLKGDWVDHLKSDKWSFRIKLKDPLSDGLKTFSIQEPSTRGHLKGFMFHKLLKQEGILTNEFRFVNLFVNGSSWGAYCLEEHLTSRLISNQNKPEGVILKFKDQAFFEAFTNHQETTGLIKTAEIKLYGDAKKDDRYEKEVAKAKRIIKDYQFQRDSVYNYFDAEQMGMYYAICDLAAAYHSMGWINIRFYFNFETKKMEPLGYDGYPVLEWGKPYLGHNADAYVGDKFETKMIVYSALKNEAIKKAYDRSLRKLTEPTYVQNFIKKHKAELDFYHDELHKDNRHFHFYENFLLDNTTAIRKALSQNK